MPTGRFAKDIVGEKFHHLTVIKRANNVTRGSGISANWLCVCDCGRETLAVGSDLVRGYRQKCGIDCPKFGHQIGDSAFNMVHADMKRQAKRRGISWELSKDQTKEITTSDCFYCGRIPSTGANRSDLRGDFLHNGIDRIDSTKGYHIENVVACCWMCNRAKSNLTVDQFREWIKSIFNHWAS